MYHRVCRADASRTFDYAYLISGVIFLCSIFLFADERLPGFLYFNSKLSRAKFNRIKKLEEKIHRRKHCLGRAESKQHRNLEDEDLLDSDTETPIEKEEELF